MTDIEYLNNSIREKIVERVKNGFFDGAGAYLKAMDYYVKGAITLDTVKAIEAEIEAWEMSKEPPVVEDSETEIEESQTETEIIEDSTNDEELLDTESTEQTTEEPATEPTE